jgi:hypothetical protein
MTKSVPEWAGIPKGSQSDFTCGPCGKTTTHDLRAAFGTLVYHCTTCGNMESKKWCDAVLHAPAPKKVSP